MAALRDLASAPTTNAALRGLTATVTTLQPQLRFLGPYFTVCNGWNTFWTFTSEHLSAPVPQGTAQRALLNFASLQDNSYGNAGAPEPANGQNVKNGPPVYFHGDVYEHAVNSSGAADCLRGQTGYIQRAFQYGAPQYNIDADPKGPGYFGYLLGPTYHTYGAYGAGQGLNPSSVPAGETFTPTPGGLAAQLPFSYAPSKAPTPVPAR
jgi:hypothetical protein